MRRAKNEAIGLWSWSAWFWVGKDRQVAVFTHDDRAARADPAPPAASGPAIEHQRPGLMSQGFRGVRQ